MCVCAACHRGWLWLCWGGTEGDLATAQGGPGHSKSVSFGGDPSRLFKRVHYRLVNASAEGETLLTALNSLCTQSPSHSLSHTNTHTYGRTHPFPSPPCSPFACVFSLEVCERLCVVFSAYPVCFPCARHTHLRLCLLFMNFMVLAFTESNTISQSLPISCIDPCALGLNAFFFCVHVCSSYGRVRVCVCVCVCSV